MRRALLMVATLVVSAQNAGAQQAATSVRVEGEVFDSLARAPLRGAVVQAVLLTDSWTPDTTHGDLRAYASVTGPDGRFLIPSMPRGRYAFGFQHQRLSALGLEPIVRAVAVTSDTALHLGLPGASALTRIVCGSDGSGGTAIVGHVSTAASREALGSARVRVAWEDVLIADGKLERVPREMGAVTSAEGQYHVCGLPSTTRLSLTIERDGFKPFQGSLTSDTDGLNQIDISLARASSRSVVGSVRGRVVDSAGHAVRAQVSIPALRVESTAERDTFTIASVPEGSWMAEVRALGFVPRTTILQVPTAEEEIPTIVLERQVVRLDTMRVTGKASRQAKILDAIHLRSLTSAGTYFLPGNSWLETATEPGDVLRAARGFILKGSGMVDARQYFLRNGAQVTCRSSNDENPSAAGPKEIAIYVDGLRYKSGFNLLNKELRPDQILAIEAYPDVISAPFEWRKNDTCAVIAIWTKP